MVSLLFQSGANGFCPSTYNPILVMAEFFLPGFTACFREAAKNRGGDGGGRGADPSASSGRAGAGPLQRGDVPRHFWFPEKGLPFGDQTQEHPGFRGRGSSSVLGKLIFGSFHPVARWCPFFPLVGQWFPFKLIQPKKGAFFAHGHWASELVLVKGRPKEVHPCF